MEASAAFKDREKRDGSCHSGLLKGMHRRLGKKEIPLNTPDQHNFASGRDTAARPAVVDRATWQAELDTLRVREKAHTRAGDALAAARRRLPTVEVDPSIQLVGPHGPVPLLEVFEGRRQLIVYFH